MVTTGAFFYRRDSSLAEKQASPPPLAIRRGFGDSSSIGWISRAGRRRRDGQDGVDTVSPFGNQLSGTFCQQKGNRRKLIINVFCVVQADSLRGWSLRDISAVGSRSGTT